MTNQYVPRSISDTIKELGLPSNTQCVGHIVHLEDTDEFLAETTGDDTCQGNVWSKIPDLSKIWDSQLDAAKFAKEYGKSSMVAMLLETDKQYMVLPSIDPDGLDTFIKEQESK
jgi:hypothetical protein